MKTARAAFPASGKRSSELLAALAISMSGVFVVRPEAAVEAPRACKITDLRIDVKPIGVNYTPDLGVSLKEVSYV